jgi:acyl-CoA synthetase (AMP-forming)/AMP-acid ligase II
LAGDDGAQMNLQPPAEVIKLANLPTVCDYVLRYAQIFPDRIAIVDDALRWTYTQLAARMRSGAAALSACGVYAGSRVAFFGFPGAGYIETLLSVMQCAAVYVGLNPKYTATELHYVLDHADIGLIIVDPRCTAEQQAALSQALNMHVKAQPVVRTLIASLPQACTDINLPAGEGVLLFPLVAGDAAALVYTSGTTGKPKGAVIRQTSLAHEGRLFAQRYLCGDVSRITRVLSNLPVNHIGCIGDLTCAWLVMSATIVFMPHFAPRDVGRVLAQEKITFYFQVPAMFQLAMAEGLDLSKLPDLERIGWGGAPCPEPIIAQFLALGFKLSNTYGLSEGTGTSSATRENASLTELSGSVGVELEEGTVRLAENGEIQLHGALLFAGYLKDENATAAAFTRDGWFCTGDVAEMDELGNIVLKGRMKEMFKSGGYNVYPREIEQAIEAVAGVEIAAVIAVPDPIWTEVSHAFVVSHAAMTVELLQQALKAKLANYKIPKYFTLVSDLPRLPVGKIDKQALLRMAS